jgi:hypothetical protein
VSFDFDFFFQAVVGEGGTAKASSVWPLRAVLALDAEAGASFVVRLRREDGSPLEYRFETAAAAARDAFVGGVLAAASAQMRYTPKSSFDWERRLRESRAVAAAGEGEGQSSVSLETLEAASQSEEDVTCQTLLWEAMEERHLSAAGAGELLEHSLRKAQRANAAALAALDAPLSGAHERAKELAAAARGAEEALSGQLPLVRGTHSGHSRTRGAARAVAATSGRAGGGAAAAHGLALRPSALSRSFARALFCAGRPR